MQIQFRKVEIAENGGQATVEFGGTVLEAHAVLQGFIDVPSPDLVRVEVVNMDGKQVTVEWTSLPAQPSQAWALVIANVELDDLSNLETTHEIQVSWNRGMPTADPDNLFVHEASSLNWVHNPADRCTIVGVLGLGHSTFGPVTGQKDEAGSLTWNCANHFSQTGSYDYSILVFNDDEKEFRYLDPKITNTEMQPPGGGDCG